MANEKNLKKFDSEQSREKARINGRKGGIASGEAKRRKKTFKEVFEALMNEEIGKDITSESLAEKAGLTLQEAIAIAVAEKAANGDVSAASFVRDTMGEKPTDKVEMDSELNITIKGI